MIATVKAVSILLYGLSITSITQFYTCLTNCSYTGWIYHLSLERDERNYLPLSTSRNATRYHQILEHQICKVLSQKIFLLSMTKHPILTALLNEFNMDNYIINMISIVKLRCMVLCCSAY